MKREGLFPLVCLRGLYEGRMENRGGGTVHTVCVYHQHLVGLSITRSLTAL